MNESIYAIVVTFNSSTLRLSKLLSSLSQQCSIIVVDNSIQILSQERIQSICENLKIYYLSLGDNFGIAHAQNIGIALAREMGATDILLMDDDSLPSQQFVRGLLDARRLSKFQPVVVSARTISEEGKDISNCPANKAERLTACGELTSSGTLISMAIFDRVKNFDDRLFIDCVDFEWGWRALALGFPLVLCNEITIQHKLGEGTQFGLKIPSPIRHYYQYRNILKLIFHSRAPFGWRLSQIIKLPVKLVLILILADQRFSRIRYAAWGIYDFFVGRYGKFDR